MAPLFLQYELIKALTGQCVPSPNPTHIFEVVASAAAEDKFQDKRAGRDLFYAYHGSRVENFHSILNFGLQSHMNKVRNVELYIFLHCELGRDL